MSAFIGKLVVELVDDIQDATWSLTEDFSYQSDVAGRTFTAPKGFVTDFCSVPNIPIVHEILGDRARKAGTIHDFLYTWPHPVTRDVADKVLLEMLAVNGVSDADAQLIYDGVRLGGAGHWDPAPGAAPARAAVQPVPLDEGLQGA